MPSTRDGAGCGRENRPSSGSSSKASSGSTMQSASNPADISSSQRPRPRRAAEQQDGSRHNAEHQDRAGPQQQPQQLGNEEAHRNSAQAPKRTAPGLTVINRREECAPAYPAAERKAGFRRYQAGRKGIVARGRGEAICPNDVRRQFLFGMAAVIPGLLAGCGDRATLPLEAGIGPDPVLPPPHATLLPTLNIAPATAWPAGATPTPAPGLRVTALARGLDHPRWLDGAAQRRHPGRRDQRARPSPDEASGVRGMVQRMIMAAAGAGTPSANRITLLRERRPRRRRAARVPGGPEFAVRDGAGRRCDSTSPTPTRCCASRTDRGKPRSTARRRQDLRPAGGADQPSLDQERGGQPRTARTLYVSVGSNSNVGENGLAAEDGRAAIWEVDRSTGEHRVFASGLRNPVGMAWSRRPARCGWR